MGFGQHSRSKVEEVASPKAPGRRRHSHERHQGRHRLEVLLGKLVEEPRLHVDASVLPELEWTSPGIVDALEASIEPARGVP